MKDFFCRLRRTFLPLFTSFCLFFSCSRGNAASSAFLTRFSGLAMTMEYSILVGGNLSFSEKKQVQRAIDLIFQKVNNVFNDWNEGSEISQINRLKHGKEYLLSEDLEYFLRQVDVLVSLTEGRFDPTVAPLFHRWKRALQAGRFPEKESLEEAKELVGWDKISFSKGCFLKEKTGTSLDLGGVAKGYAVDLLLEKLSSMGYGNLYVSWGGELRVLGQHPSKRAWKIGIERWSKENGVLSLGDGALATSGDYFQNWYLQVEGKPEHYAHILNPIKGELVKISPTSLSSVSIQAENCLLADALATACLTFDGHEELMCWLEEKRRYVKIDYWILLQDGRCFTSKSG